MKHKRILSAVSIALLATPFLASCGFKAPSLSNFEKVSKDINGTTHEFYKINGHFYEMVEIHEGLGQGQNVKLIENMGGHLISLETEEEFNFVLALSANLKRSIDVGAFKLPNTGEIVWATGEKVQPTYKALEKMIDDHKNTYDEYKNYYVYGYSKMLDTFDAAKFYEGNFSLNFIHDTKYLVEWECEEDLYGAKKYNFFKPVHVSTEDEFIKQVQDRYVGGIELDNDITFTKSVYFADSISIFGNNHTLKFKDYDTDQNPGIFNSVPKYESVKDLVVERNVVINARNDVAGFVNVLNGTMDNVTFKGVVKHSDVKETFRTAGLVTRLGKGAKLLNCVNEADVTGYHDVGGVFAVNDQDDVTIFNCVNKGNIVGQNSIGGVCGKIVMQKTVVLSNLYNEGSVTGNQEVGGVIGRVTLKHVTTNVMESNIIEELTLSSCDNYGAVVGVKQVGGCFGAVHGECNVPFDLGKSHCNVYIYFCRNFGTINGETTAYDKKNQIGNVIGLFYADGSNSDSQGCGVEEVYTSAFAVGAYENGSVVVA